MDEFTNLRHYPSPRTRPGSLNFVIAEKDEYVPRSEFVPDASELWNGAAVNVVPDVGHVLAYVM